MKRILKMTTALCGILSASVLFALAQPSTNTSPAQKFVFKYEPNHPLLYTIDLKIGMDMNMNAGTESIKTAMSFDLRYKVKLTATNEPVNGVSTLRMESSGVEGDWDIHGPAGHIVIALRGSQMKGTQDGVVTIDTTNDIGTAEAQDFKKDIMALYLSGFGDMDTRGNVRQFYGDLPFVEFWSDAIRDQIGFFGIVLPENTVAVGESWKENLAMKKMGQITLDGEGLQCTVTFTRMADTITPGGPLSTFSMSAPFSHKNLTGYMEQGGQRMGVNVSRFNRTATGSFHFDSQRGVLKDSKAKVDADGVMTMVAQGQSMTADLKMNMDMQIKLDEK